MSNGLVIPSPRTCPHADVEPVEVRSRTTGRAEIVAHVCCDCLAALPANWGCTDCTWVEIRSQADVVPELLPETLCPTHAKAAIP